MQVSVLRGVGQVAVEERSVPEPAADEVLVEIGSVGVCGSDVHYFEHGRIGPYVVNSPLVLGHEAGGVVAAVGACGHGLDPQVLSATMAAVTISACPTNGDCDASPMIRLTSLR